MLYNSHKLHSASQHSLSTFMLRSKGIKAGSFVGTILPRSSGETAPCLKPCIFCRPVCTQALLDLCRREFIVKWYFKPQACSVHCLQPIETCRNILQARRPERITWEHLVPHHGESRMESKVVSFLVCLNAIFILVRSGRTLAW